MFAEGLEAVAGAGPGFWGAGPKRMLRRVFSEPLLRPGHTESPMNLIPSRKDSSQATSAGPAAPPAANTPFRRHGSTEATPCPAVLSFVLRIEGLPENPPVTAAVPLQGPVLSVTGVTHTP